MTKKIIILALVLGAISAKAETLEIDGFAISFSDGCQIILSLDGDIKRVTMPDGDIKLDSSGKIKSVGGAIIKRDSSEVIIKVGGAKIERDKSGTITGIGSSGITVRASFKVLADKI